MTIFNRRSDPNESCVTSAANTVPDRILRQRLQHQVWHEGFHGCRIDVEFDLEPIGKPHFLNTQIQLNEVEFFSQFNFLFGGVFERVAQKVAQSDEHTYRCVVLVVANETDDAVQSVE